VQYVHADSSAVLETIFILNGSECLVSIHSDVILVPSHTLDTRPQFCTMPVPQTPAVTSFSSLFQPPTQLAAVDSNKVCLCG
jgi:hypothetical protein